MRCHCRRSRQRQSPDRLRPKMPQCVALRLYRPCRQHRRLADNRSDYSGSDYSLCSRRFFLHTRNTTDFFHACRTRYRSPDVCMCHRFNTHCDVADAQGPVSGHGIGASDGRSGSQLRLVHTDISRNGQKSGGHISCRHYRRCACVRTCY